MRRFAERVPFIGSVVLKAREAEMAYEEVKNAGSAFSLYIGNLRALESRGIDGCPPESLPFINLCPKLVEFLQSILQAKDDLRNAAKLRQDEQHERQRSDFESRRRNEGMEVVIKKLNKLDENLDNWKTAQAAPAVSPQLGAPPPAGLPNQFSEIVFSVQKVIGDLNSIASDCSNGLSDLRTAVGESQQLAEVERLRQEGERKYFEQERELLHQKHAKVLSLEEGLAKLLFQYGQRVDEQMRLAKLAKQESDRIVAEAEAKASELLCKAAADRESMLKDIQLAHAEVSALREECKTNLAGVMEKQKGLEDRERDLGVLESNLMLQENALHERSRLVEDAAKDAEKKAGRAQEMEQAALNLQQEANQIKATVENSRKQLWPDCVSPRDIQPSQSELENMASGSNSAALELLAHLGVFSAYDKTQSADSDLQSVLKAIGRSLGEYLKKTGVDAVEAQRRMKSWATAFNGIASNRYLLTVPGIGDQFRKDEMQTDQPGLQDVRRVLSWRVAEFAKAVVE